MGNQKPHKQLYKFLSYILGRRPDEFGLVPDDNGFVKIKELIKAVNEEEGWRHVRRGLIDEITVVLPDSPIEIADNLIRAKSVKHRYKIKPAQDIPKILFTCVTRQSYPFVLEKGIFPTRHEYVIMSSDKDLALRIGKRKGPEPVVLTVNVKYAVDMEVDFFQSGELLFLSTFLPVECFSGPSLPKNKVEIKKKPVKIEPKEPKTPGSFELNLEPGSGYKKSAKSKKGEKSSWKRDKKRIRRESRKDWPS